MPREIRGPTKDKRGVVHGAAGGACDSPQEGGCLGEVRRALQRHAAGERCTLVVESTQWLSSDGCVANLRLSKSVAEP